MYAREVQGKTLTFTVSGMLWQMSLVMMDKETESLWSHLLGEAMQGELVGEKLDVIPSYMTDWKSWKSTHPETTCLAMSRTADSFDRRMIQRESKHARLMIGVVDQSTSRGWHLNDLRSRRVVNDQFETKPVVVVFDDSSGAAVVYGRTVDDRALTFEWNEGKLVDRESESEWALLTGTAVSGPLAGKRLGPQLGIVSFGLAWRHFHPESTYWMSEAKPLPAEAAVPPTVGTDVSIE